MREGPDPGRTVDEALERLTALLAEERGALRRRDAAEIARQAVEKEALLGVVMLARESIAPAQAFRLRTLSSELRHNAILLAFARDSLRDALAAIERAGAATPAARGRLHVIG